MEGYSRVARERTYPGCTPDDILCVAKRLIVDFGWKRNAWPEYGPAPRSIRSALHCAATDLDAVSMSAHGDAIRRVSEAIYGRGTIGGINDWEHRKATTHEAVIAVLQKAIEMGPWPDEEQNSEVWPT